MQNHRERHLQIGKAARQQAPRSSHGDSTRFAQRTRAEWEAVFAGTDACVTPVLSLEEAPEHPQNASRDVFGGPVGHRLPGIAPRFDGRHPDDLSAVREPGTDTTAILSDLGYGAAEISALRRNGTVA